MSKERDYASEGECWFCTEVCTRSQYCDGCGAHICDTCNEIGVEDLEDFHQPEEHQADLLGG